MWIFEPSVAEKIFEESVIQPDIKLFRDEWLDCENGMTKRGKSFRGKIFIDATCEGDLMAAAGVSYHAEREGKDVHGE